MRADREAADDVDDQDQDAGDGVAADELAGAVHGAVEVGLRAHFRAARARLVLVDQAGVQVGVDRHLLARHRIQGEARADFGDAARALGDHHEVDDGQDRRTPPRRRRSCRRPRTRRRPRSRGRRPPGPSWPCSSTTRVEATFSARRSKVASSSTVGKTPKSSGRGDVEHRHHDHDRQRDVEGEQHVQRERRQRQHHHRQHRQQQHRHADAPLQQRSSGSRRTAWSVSAVQPCA